MANDNKELATAENKQHSIVFVRVVELPKASSDRDRAEETKDARCPATRCVVGEVRAELEEGSMLSQGASGGRSTSQSEVMLHRIRFLAAAYVIVSCN